MKAYPTYLLSLRNDAVAARQQLHALMEKKEGSQSYYLDRFIQSIENADKAALTWMTYLFLFADFAGGQIIYSQYKGKSQANYCAHLLFASCLKQAEQGRGLSQLRHQLERQVCDDAPNELLKLCDSICRGYGDVLSGELAIACEKGSESDASDSSSSSSSLASSSSETEFVKVATKNQDGGSERTHQSEPDLASVPTGNKLKTLFMKHSGWHNDLENQVKQLMLTERGACVYTVDKYRVILAMVQRIVTLTKEDSSVVPLFSLLVKYRFIEGGARSEQRKALHSRLDVLSVVAGSAAMLSPWFPRGHLADSDTALTALVVLLVGFGVMYGFAQGQLAALNEAAPSRSRQAKPIPASVKSSGGGCPLGFG